jgi:hypothetical protein
MITPTNVTPRPIRPPNTRRLAAVLVLGAALSIMLLGPVGVAVAQDCPATDPTCVIDTVDDTVGDVQKTVDDTTSTAKDEVAATTDKVRATLDELTGSGGGQPPGGGDGDGSNGHDGGAKHDGGGSNGGSVHPAGTTAGASILAREGGTLTLFDTSTLGRSDEGSTDPSSHQTLGVGTRLREAATGIAVSLLIVLGAVLVFTAIQGRFDRRDPKLSLAPLTADVLTFT